MKISRIIITISITFIILLVLAYFVIEQGQQSQSQIPVLYEVPEFHFTERNGEAVGRSIFSGRITVVDFIFTNCPGPCPLMSQRMSELYDLYSGTDKVGFVSISVDPNRDSLEALRQYADRFGVNDQRWLFLRAPIDQVIDLYENGFKLGGLLPADHSTKFILVDNKGRIRGYYDSLDDISLSILKTNIKQLMKQMQ